MQKRILTGLRANSEMHLGNYIGAILPMVQLQKKSGAEFAFNFFVPDLHSITTTVDYRALAKNIQANVRYYIAAGLNLDHTSTYIYRQSRIAAHSELAWILSCFTYYGELQRMTQFKEKKQSAKDESVTAGLFTYPVLMAADILLYGATYVPVGDDQRQHLELARDLAIRINNRFNDDIFIVPEAWDKQLSFSGRVKGVRIRSLLNPEHKMSKSVSDPKGTILLNEDASSAKKKILSATTDSVGAIHFDWKVQPGISNLLQIEALLSDTPLNEIVDFWTGKTNYGELKKAVATTVATFLDELHKVEQKVDDGEILSMLEADEKEMEKLARTRLLAVQKAVGLRK